MAIKIASSGFVAILLLFASLISLSGCTNQQMSAEDMRRWWTAIEQGDTAAVRTLIRTGTPMDSRCGPNLICKPLAVATDMGNIEIMKILIDAGADLNGENAYGDTPLIYASDSTGRHRQEAITLLIESGADVNKPNCFGMNVFIVSAARGDVKLLEVLLQHGARINAIYPSSCSTIYDADPNALMYAAEEGQLEAVRFLLEHGADPLYKDAKGHAALYYAKKKGHKSIEALLR